MHTFIITNSNDNDPFQDYELIQSWRAFPIPWQSILPKYFDLFTNHDEEKVQRDIVWISTTFAVVIIINSKLESWDNEKLSQVIIFLCGP